MVLNAYRIAFEQVSLHKGKIVLGFILHGVVIVQTACRYTPRHRADLTHQQGTDQNVPGCNTQQKAPLPVEKRIKE